MNKSKKLLNLVIILSLSVLIIEADYLLLKLNHLSNTKMKPKSLFRSSHVSKGTKARNNFNEDQRIAGGKKASEGQFPYQLSQRCRGIHNCGAVLFNDSIALSAAHCCISFDTETCQDMTLAGGANILSSDETQIRKIKSWKMHQNFTRRTMLYDICILYVDEPFQIDSMKMSPISLGDDSTCFVGQNCQISGWGVEEYDDFNFPTDLLYADVPILEDKHCEAYPIYNERLMVCAGFLTGQIDSCKGDSGGALVCEKKICGIVSFGHKCAIKDYPGVYAKITALQQWVLDTISENND